MNWRFYSDNNYVHESVFAAFGSKYGYFCSGYIIWNINILREKSDFFGKYLNVIIIRDSLPNILYFFYKMMFSIFIIW